MSYHQEIQSFTPTQGRDFPWVHVGDKVEGTQTLDEILDAAGLSGWNLESQIVVTETGLRVPSKYAIVRPDADAVLGVVGSRYRIHQNEEAFAPVQDILDSSDLVPDTAGVKDCGKQVFISLALPEGVQIAGADRHEARLLAVTSHDGSLATTFAVIMGRFACFNALRPSLATPRKFSIRHTQNSAYRIAEAREALEITFNYVDEFSIQMEKWLDEPLRDVEFEHLVERMLPIRVGLSEGRVQAVEDRRANLWNLYENSPTNEFGRGTKYAAYNAMNEYSNWYLPVRADRDGSKRAHRTMDDESLVAKFDLKAQRLLMGV